MKTFPDPYAPVHAFGVASMGPRVVGGGEAWGCKGRRRGRLHEARSRRLEVNRRASGLYVVGTPWPDGSWPNSSRKADEDSETCRLPVRDHFLRKPTEGRLRLRIA